MIRHILTLVFFAICGAPVGVGARVLFNDFIHDRRANKRAKKAEKKELMNRDWNFNTAWLYDDPRSAERQIDPNSQFDWKVCMICRHIYYSFPSKSTFKVGYSCLKSMEVHVIGYCDAHYAYLQPEMDADRVLCHCGEEAGDVHEFEEIIIDEV